VGSQSHRAVLCPSAQIFGKIGLKFRCNLQFKCDFEQNAFWTLTIASKANLWKYAETVQHNTENHKIAISFWPKSGPKTLQQSSYAVSHHFVQWALLSEQSTRQISSSVSRNGSSGLFEFRINFWSYESVSHFMRLLGRGIGQSEGSPLPTQVKHWQITMPRAGLERTTAVFERSKTVKYAIRDSL
jgi:hypothetical protein